MSLLHTDSELLFSVWLWNIQLFTDKYTQVGVDICMARNISTVAVVMIHVLVMSCTMLQKTTSMSIKVLYEFYSFHSL